MADSTHWRIERVKVEGGSSVWELIVVCHGKTVDRGLFATREAANEARDAAVHFYDGHTANG